MTPAPAAPMPTAVPVLPGAPPSSPMWLHQQRVSQRRSRKVVGVALVLGVLAELLFDGSSLGVSVPLFALAVLGALWLLAGTERWRQAAQARWLAAPLLFFATMVAVRDSEALTLGNLAACAGLGALLIQLFTGEHASEAPAGKLLLLTVQGVTMGLRSAPQAVAKSIDSHGLRDGAQRLVWPTVRAVMLTVPLLGVFVGLLMAGDRRFAQFIIEVDALDWGSMVTASLIVIVVGLAFTGLFTHALRPGLSSPSTAAGEPPAPGPLRLSDALVPLFSISALFAVFGLVRMQAVLNFDKYVAASRPEFTYATEAHRGFGALAAVVVLSLAVLLAFSRFTRLDSPRQQRWFAAAGTTLVLLTGPVLWSGLSRLWLYMEMYGYTQLRVYALWLVVVAAVLLSWRGLTLWWLRSRFGVGAIATVLLCWAGLNLLNPDAVIAERNLTRPKSIVELDESYLLGLSADAAPVLLEHFGNSEVLRPYLERLAAPRGLAGWRWSYARVRSLDAARPR